ncbi:uncharacterized protein LOC133533570 isoform X2 [Cydia pomonella]|uniref:uncharacterized protein LOC133533570 isoform X2 n=1 Tax=Cydia pomonella TaxID=82600 RepID=UPI002ADDD50A|nr:uncharacterized protein LOC133533570 isoform X2 [Cydia pomonella]
MANFNILTVREMIDASFGETDSNCPVNLKMVGSVLFILARRMELLKRHFKVEVHQKIAPKSTFVVTEIKIHTKGKKKKRKARLLVDESGKIRRPQKRSSLPSYKIPPRQRFSDDSSTETSSTEERSTKKSHKRTGEKHLQTKRLAQVYRSEQLIARKYCHETSPSERERTRKHSDGRSPAAHQRVYTGKSLASRQNTKKYSDEMSSARQGKPQKYSDDMSQSERRKDIKSTAERKRDYSETYPSERSRSGKHSDERSWDLGQGSERNRARNYYSPSDEPSSESAISGETRTKKPFDHKGKTDSERRSKSYTGIFRGKEIHERKITFQSSDDDVIETQHEKIYIVATVITPSGENIRGSTDNWNPVVTQEQYNRLLAKIRKLQSKFRISKKFDDLTKTTSMTHPKAAMNISVRLDRAENRLAHLLKIVTQLASQVPKTELQAVLNEISVSGNEPKSFKISGPQSDPITGLLEAHDTDNQTFQASGGQAFESSLGGQAVVPSKLQENVRHGEMNDELEKILFSVVREIQQAIADARIEKCGRALGGNEIRVALIQKHFNEIFGLHYKIEKCGKAVADIDERMTTQIALFQDNLLLMQADLETALDKVADSLLSPKEDAAAVAQIVETFLEYKSDLVNTEYIQVELKHDIEHYLKKLETLAKKVELLRNRKCTRQQMFEALSDKLTLKDINGLLTQSQFGAVTASNKDTFQNLRLKIFSKECDWQFAIDNFVAKCGACADIIQLATLNDSMQQRFTRMDKDLDDMFTIVMPPKTYPTDKKVQRDEKCLSCGAPTEVVKDELNLRLWQEIISTAPVPADKTKFKYGEIAGICIPGRPIPHPLEQGSYICEHDCGEIVNTTEELLELFIKRLNPDSPNSAAVPDTDKTQVGDH